MQACDGNLEQAIGLFFASDGAIGAQNVPPQGQADIDDDIIELDPRENQPVAFDDSNTGVENGIRNPMAPISGRLVDQSYQDYYGKINEYLFYGCF